MKLRVAGTILMLALVAGCAESDKEMGTPEDDTAIRAENTRYAGLWNAKDTTAIFATMADDYVEVNADGVQMNDKAAAMENLRKDFRSRPDGMSLSLTTRFVKFLDDDVAITGGTWTVAGMPPGSPSTGAWNATVRRDGETWKTVNGLVATAVNPAAVAPGAEAPGAVAPAATADTTPPTPAQ